MSVALDEQVSREHEQWNGDKVRIDLIHTETVEHVIKRIMNMC